MRYLDGSIIRVGDLVWWDEGHCVGYIQVIAQTKEEYESWGLGCPHIFISNRHPFDPSLRTGVAHDASCFEDEGIGLLTPKERQELERAATKARIELKLPSANLSYAVTTEVQDGQQTGWQFTFFKDGQQSGIVKIPAHQNENGH